MGKVRRTPAAEEDLAQVSETIANDNPAAGSRWLDDMRDAFELLASQPQIGQLLQSKRNGAVRRHAIGNYLIYYRPLSDGVEILHVVHGARDQNKII